MGINIVVVPKVKVDVVSFVKSNTGWTMVGIGEMTGPTGVGSDLLVR
jgi:hypothetical protein